jgi:CheY-like chemotaxis protein
MYKNLVVVGESKSSFILNAIQGALQQAGFMVRCVEPRVNDLGILAKNNVDVFVIYTGDYIKNASEAIIYIKDYCVEHDKYVYLIGYDYDAEEFMKIIPGNVVQHTFGRPLNVKEMVERITEDSETMQENKKHILVVDDSGTMLRTIKSWLSEKYQVSMASSSAMAISFLANNKPDLILLDYEMPICSGPQFLEMIHAEPTTRNIPVIFLTAKDDIESVTKVLALKPAGYLLKTMKPMEIVSSIDSFFEKLKSEVH